MVPVPGGLWRTTRPVAELGKGWMKNWKKNWKKKLKNERVTFVSLIDPKTFEAFHENEIQC